MNVASSRGQAVNDAVFHQRLQGQLWDLGFFALRRNIDIQDRLNVMNDIDQIDIFSDIVDFVL